MTVLALLPTTPELDDLTVSVFLENLPLVMTNLALFIRWFVGVAETT